MLDCLNPNGFSESKTHPGKLMEQYIESGSYKQLKELSFEHDELHKRISAYFMEHEAKRHEIGYNLVAKFVTRNVFQYDYVGLNEYLYDLGLLQKVTKISGKCIKQYDLLDLFDAFGSEPEYYIKPSLNKAGREMVQVEPPTDFPFTLEEAAKKKRENIERLKPAKFDYQILKKQLLKCGQLISEQVVKHKYGSISRLQKPCHYDVSQITDHH
ncbi:hypothetical protein ACE38V_13430 [Cytobacillus sp. Hz8]|uniref:hypothetical protein n=1 Tax=Cytobacillus sp. Hz8 TaxID=3347168 RepID=UPI0035DCF690